MTSSSYPYLSECFRDTILQWIPMSIFWLILPIWLHIFFKDPSKPPTLAVSNLFVIKTILGALFLLVQVLRIVHYVVFSIEEQNQAYFFTSILYIITVVTVLWLMNFDRLNGTFSSGLLFIFWLLVSLAILPDTIGYSMTFQKQIKSVSLWMKMIVIWLHFIFGFGSFLTNCFAEKRPTHENRGIFPELYVSFPSRIFYTWVTPLILRGYQRPLTEKDCWQLPVSEQTVTVVRQVVKYTKRNGREVLNKDNASNLKNASPNLVAADIQEVPFSNWRGVIFWHALFITFKDKIIVGGLLRLTHDLLQLSGPMILKLLLQFFNDPTSPVWLGISYAVLLGTTAFLETLLMRAYAHCQFITGLRFRSAITGFVYRKSLKLSNSSKQETTTGEIVNLMAIDAARFGEITTQLHTLWSGPLRIVIALVLLHQQLQWAIIPGIAVLLLVIPLNLFLQRIQKKLTLKQMHVKDQRIKMMNEILNGIRVLKLNAWEMAFIRSIHHIRDKELRYIRSKAILSAFSGMLWTFTPILVCITTFATYVFSSKTNILTSDKAFVSLALFNLLRAPLVLFPSVINSVVEARVSNQRIQKFLSREEIDEHAVDHRNSNERLSNEHSVSIRNGSFRWLNLGDHLWTLNNINLQIQQGSLVALVGMVGSGKSSILAALLGEMVKVSGHVTVYGTIAYVPQTAWILNTTLKQNILFGRSFNRKLYNQVIEACALKQDFDMLPARDETEIGEKGINLSGGQRQRVSLARALYSNADVYLLDDPLSAVDAHVGAHIFQRVIGPNSLLSGKTRLFVTNGVSHLYKCDEIILISQGRILDHGSYNDLVNRSEILRELVRSIVVSSDKEHQCSEQEEPISVLTTETEGLATNDSDLQQDDSQSIIIEIEDEKKILVKKEVAQTGSVKLNIFWTYMRACQLPTVIFIILFFWLTVIASLSANIRLAKWTDHVKVQAVRNVTSSHSQIHHIHVYATLSIVQGVLAFLMQLMLKFGTYVAGRKLHWVILLGVLQAPMSFFDTTPIGRIINRFSKDIDSVDSTLPYAFSQSFTTLITMVTTLIILIYGSWLTIFELIPFTIVFLFIQRVYISSSRQLRRLDSISRSSIFSNFSETIQGLSSIRAYHVQPRFINLSDELIDKNQACHLASSVATRWLGVRLETIANLLIFFTSVGAVLMRDRLTAGSVGLMIAFVMQITTSLNMLVRVTSEIETNIVSVERINEYAQLTSEAPWEIPLKKPSIHWPSKGEIRIMDLSTRYRQNLQLVLEDVTIHVQSGEKIGIIGRTGSGKSSLCLALFRIIEPANGTIMIDDVDICHIGLHDLRSKITIIPQDAVIFAGTVRFNIDPLGNYSDTEIWAVLELSYMKERVSNMESGLSYQLAEGGQNLSAGEKQLLCLARALLRKSKIFILDEATAAIDMQTDRLIQSTIRSVIKNATVLTIAHRLHTVLDSTKILVLSNGSLEEYDAPTQLAADPNSAFSKLLTDASMRPSDNAT